TTSSTTRRTRPVKRNVMSPPCPPMGSQPRKAGLPPQSLALSGKLDTAARRGQATAPTPVSQNHQKARGRALSAERPLPAGDLGGHFTSSILVSRRSMVAVNVESIRVAAVQATPAILDVEGCVEKVERLTRDAAAEGAQLVVLPETFIPMYPMSRLTRSDWD